MENETICPQSAEDLMKENKQLQEENKQLRETLRDKFAMAALTGLMSATDSDGSWTTVTRYASTLAYEAADEMLKERDK